MQRWHCPIYLNYNGTIKSFVWLSKELDIHVLVSSKCLFLFEVTLQTELAHFLLLRINEESHKNKHFSSQKHDVILQIFSQIQGTS